MCKTIMNSVSAGETDLYELATVTQLVSRLIHDLDGISGDELPTRTAPTLASWADADYIYLEAGLPAGTELEADITVHDSKVFIRIVK
jgi:hypothetical protein